MRRVVVTGLGMVTPLACGVDPTWRRLINGESGISPVERIDVSDLSARIAGQIPRGDGSNGTYNPDQWMEPKEQRKVDEFIVYAMCAAKQALDDAGWKPESHDDQCASGVMIGSGIGGAGGIADTGVLLKERGPRRVSPFFVPGRIINMASGYVSIEHGLKGPNSAVVTACSTGSHAIGDAGRMIALGDADVMVAGGDGIPDQPHFDGGLRRLRALFRRRSTTIRHAPRGLTTKTAMVSCWPRALVWSCLRNTITLRRAAPKSTPSWLAMGFRATPIILRRRRQMATARSVA